MFFAHPGVFPPTPRLKSVALPDDMNEDEGFLSKALYSRADAPPGADNSLGLFDMISSTAAPLIHELKKLSSRIHALALEASPSKVSRRTLSLGQSSLSPTAFTFGRSSRGQ